MPPLKHAKLSPSSSSRWISCPASIRMESSVARIEEVESFYAREGTAAHALAEIKATDAFLSPMDGYLEEALADWAREFEEFALDTDMVGHADGYVGFLRERLNNHPMSNIMLEQRMDCGVPAVWGTSDAVIVSPTHVEVVDFKYGMGVHVSAVGNSQARLYACGALDLFDGLLGDVETVTTTIYQPRVDNVSSETLSAGGMRQWRDQIIPIAESALGPDAPFGPSVEACRWCPVSGMCRAQLEHFAETDFAVDTELLSPGEIADELERVPFVKQWVQAVESRAMELAYGSGVPIPGWKVVSSGSRRSIPDQKGAILHLESYVPAGRDEPYPVEEFANLKLKGIGELEKLLGGRSLFDDALGEYVTKSEGSPSLVRESDRRKAIDPNTEAQKDFLEWKEPE